MIIFICSLLNTDCSISPLYNVIEVNFINAKVNLTHELQPIFRVIFLYHFVVKILHNSLITLKTFETLNLV